MGNQVMMLTNKGVFTTTNGQDINPTAVTDSVQAFLTFNNSVLIGTRKGLYQSNGENITLTNVNQSVSSLYKSNKLALAKADSLYFTTNGMVWKPVIKLNNIYFANATDSLYVSNDNVNWRNGNLGAVSTLIYKDNFIETTINGKKYYSSDGSFWGKGIWLSGGYSLNKGVYSRDGIKWYSINVSSINGYDFIDPREIYFNKGVYNKIVLTPNSNRSVINSYLLLYSLDGINWYKTNLEYNAIIGFETNYSKIYLVNNKLLTSINDITYISENGISWTISQNNFNIIGEFNNKIYSTDGNFIYSSTNGSNWIKDRGWLNGLSHIAFSNNYFLGYVNSGIYSCGYGSDWEKIYSLKSNIGSSIGTEYVEDINCFQNQCIIAISESDSTKIQKGRLVNYNQISKQFTEISNYTKYTSFVGNINNKWFALTGDLTYTYGCSGIGCGGYVYYSNDGLNWFPTNLRHNHFYSINKVINYFENIWLGIENANRETIGLYYSYDGINWLPTNIISTRVNYIVKNDKIFVANTGHHEIYYSFDGKNWLETNQKKQVNAFNDGRLYYFDE